MKENDYDIPSMSPEEKEFLISHQVTPDLIDLYERIREKVFLFGKIEVHKTRNYIVFTHPYKQWNYYTRTNEEKLGTLIAVHFRKGTIALGFNTLGKVPLDPKNYLKATSSFGVCEFYASLKPDDDLSPLDDIIRQTIKFMSHESRIVKINGKYISI